MTQNNGDLILELGVPLPLDLEIDSQSVVFVEKAENISYDNEESGLAAENVQDALDEIQSEVILKADASDVEQALALKADATDLTAHIEDYNNPHQVTAAQVGLGNVDNTSDADKPISTATQSALDLKADKADTYTKAETDTLLSAKANSADVYTKGETDTLLSAKANSADVYTKSEADTLLANKANVGDSYTKAEEDTLLAGKQDVLTFDNYPVEDSANPVKSGGLWALILDIIQRIPLIVKKAFSAGNPVVITDAEAGNADEIKVSVSPKQSATPVIDSTPDTDPYVFRQIPVTDRNREYDKIIGGSVVWNQLIPSYESGVVTDFANKGLTATLSENNTKLTVTGTATSSGNINSFFSGFSIIKGHVYILDHRMTGTGFPGLRFSSYGFTGLGSAQIKKATTNGSPTGLMVITSGDSYNFVIQTQFTDLTQLFGNQTMAESVLAMGDTDGVALFYKYFGDKYHAYTATPSIQSVSVSEKVLTGKNLASAFVAQSNYSGTITNTGSKYTFTPSGTYMGWFINYPIKGGYTYTLSFTKTSGTVSNLRLYDDLSATTNIQDLPSVNGGTFTAKADGYIRFFETGTLVLDVIQLELGESASSYVDPITPTTISLDHTELLGIPKLDANNKLYYDGDEYPSSGSGTKKYWIVDLGDFNWVSATYGGVQGFYSTWNVVEPVPNGSGNVPNAIIPNFLPQKDSTFNTDGIDREFTINAYNNVKIKCSAYSDATAFKSAMSGVYMVYELATPTTLTLTPYTNPQDIDPNGTESYTDYPVSQGTRDVAIPVGHTSYYAKEVPIVGMDSVDVTITGKNIADPQVLLDAGYTYNDGEYYASASKLFYFRPKFKENTSYTISYKVRNATSTSSAWRMYINYTDGTVSDMAAISSQTLTEITFTTPSTKTIDFITRRYGTGSAIYLSDVQFEEGTQTAYEAYNGTTYTTTLSPTMYGGTVNVLGGTGAREDSMAKVDLNTLTWYQYGSDPNTFYSSVLSGANGTSTIIISDLYTQSAVLAYQEDHTIYIASTNRLYIKDSRYTDPTEFVYEMGATEIVYELATPTTSNLTEQTVSMLDGTNVVSTDGDSVAGIYTQNLEAYLNEFGGA